MNLFDEASPEPTKPTPSTDLYRGSRCRIDKRGVLIVGGVDMTRAAVSSLMVAKIVIVSEQKCTIGRVETFSVGSARINRVCTDAGETYWMPANK